MPRVYHVKKARKDNPVCKAGESYYWWKFRYGGKRYSLTRPRPSQLTQSPYYSTIRSILEMIEDASPADPDEVISLRDEVRDQITELRDETQGSLDNMPDSLQYSPTGELLQERVLALDNAEGELDNIDEFDEEEPQESDFTPMAETCDNCEGRGYEDEEEPEEICLNCNGEGEVEPDDDSEYQDALSSWESDRTEYIENAVSEMTEAVSNCEV